MSSRSLEPLQPSPWVALAPSPTLVWPAKKKTRQNLILIGDSWYTGPWCKDSRFELFLLEKKHACLKIILVSTTNFPTFTAYWECFNVWNPPIIYRCIIYIIYVRIDEMLFVTHIMMIFLCDLNKNSTFSAKVLASVRSCGSLGEDHPDSSKKRSSLHEVWSLLI